MSKVTKSHWTQGEWYLDITITLPLQTRSVLPSAGVDSTRSVLSSLKTTDIPHYLNISGELGTTIQPGAKVTLTGMVDTRILFSREHDICAEYGAAASPIPPGTYLFRYPFTNDLAPPLNTDINVNARAKNADGTPLYNLDFLIKFTS